MELNILLRGQSNSALFDQAGGSIRLKAALESRLGFDGISDRVNLIGASTPDENGNLTMIGGSGFLPYFPQAPRWLETPSGGPEGPYSVGRWERSMLDHVLSLPDDVRLSPTAVIWMHDETDSVADDTTEAQWTAGVRYDAIQLRAALGQSADTVPYLFTSVIPFDMGTNATMQAIKRGMEALSLDASFNAIIGTHTGDLDMDNPLNGLDGPDEGRIIYGGPHVDGADIDLLVDRLGRSLANTFSSYAKPGSPLYNASGRLDSTGPQVISAVLSGRTSLTASLHMDSLSPVLHSLSVGAASGLGWTVRDTIGHEARATSASLDSNGNLALTFDREIPVGGSLFYGWGTGRIAIGAEDHNRFGTGYPGIGPGFPSRGNSIYDGEGEPVWESAMGITVVAPILFDNNYYLTNNPDVKAAGINPLEHFNQFGVNEGRQPSLLFDDAKYLAAYSDVKDAGVNPLQHYLSFGLNEGRMAFLTGGSENADDLVNASYYDKQLGATLIPTGIAAAQQAAWSYDTSGWQSGLNPDAFFDTNYYLSHNPDVAAAALSA